MSEELKSRLRDAVMETFRSWGGQWNVSPVAPGEGEAPADRWLLRVHSRPIARGSVSADVVHAYLADPSDAAALARWEEQLTPIFDAARAAAP